MQARSRYSDVQTLEDTRCVFVLPFIRALGYDVEECSMIKPDYKVGIEGKGEVTADFVIVEDERPVICFMCRPCRAEIRDEDIDALGGIFSSTGAKFGVLTDGIAYRFFTDVESPGKMDPTPFFEFSLLNATKNGVKTLGMFSPGEFNPEKVYTRAKELKQVQKVKKILTQQLMEPSDAFVDFMCGEMDKSTDTGERSRVCAGVIKKAFNDLVDEKITNRVRAAERVAQVMTMSPPVRRQKAVSRVEPLTEIVKKSLVYKKPTEFTFMDQSYKVKSWREVLRKVSQILVKECPDRFERALTLQGRNRYYFSRIKEVLVQPREIEDTGIYVEIDLSSRDIITLIGQIIKLCGYKDDDIKVATRAFSFRRR